MDFSLLHEHPWATVGIIAGGGLLLFIVFRSKSAGAADTTGGVVYSGTDPTTVAANAQLSANSDQISGQIQQLSIQGQTAIALGQLNSNVQQSTISATQEVTDRQTDAQLKLGLGTLDAQIAHDAISAQVQMDTISALIKAYSGSSGIGSPVVTGTPVSNATSNPINQTTPGPSYSLPSYGAPATPAGLPGPTELVQNGGQLIPFPTFAQCDPFDSACAASNNIISANYGATLANDQSVNNVRREISNYQISVDAGTITPAQLAEMKRLQGMVS